MAQGGSHRPTNMPYSMSSEAPTEGATLQPGGDVYVGNAAVALNLGDVVYLIANDQFTKSLTLANYGSNVLKGIVVGGARTTFGHVPSSVDSKLFLGTLVAAANENVLVQMYGIQWVQVDAATTLNARLTASAGAIGKCSPTGAVAGNVIGTALDATAGVGNVRVFISQA